jgi:DNA transformation protein
MNESGFVDHCLELLSPLGAASARRMFGGHGLYIDGLCMALIIRDVLYLKVDDPHRAAFEAAHCKPFTYAGKNDEIHVMSYYTAPEAAMESAAEMTPWSRRALAAAVAARAKAPPKKKAPARKTGAAAKTVAPGKTAAKPKAAAPTARSPAKKVPAAAAATKAASARPPSAT